MRLSASLNESPERRGDPQTVVDDGLRYSIGQPAGPQIDRPRVDAEHIGEHRDKPRRDRPRATLPVGDPRLRDAQSLTQLSLGHPRREPGRGEPRDR